MKTNVCAHGRLSSGGHNEQRLTRWTNDDNFLFRAWSEDTHLNLAEIAYHQLIIKFPFRNGLGENNCDNMYAMPNAMENVTHVELLRTSYS